MISVLIADIVVVAVIIFQFSSLVFFLVQSFRKTPSDEYPIICPRCDFPIKREEKTCPRCGQNIV